MIKQHIVINDTLNILNSRSEVVYQFQKGEKVEIEATTDWYWCTKHGVVWFSQAKHELQIIRDRHWQEMRERQAAYILFTLLTAGRI